MNDQLNKLLDIVKKNQPNADCELIIKAYNFAKEAHKDQKRVSGLPYIMHPLSVATIVASMKMDTESIIAAMLHDVVEDTDFSIEDVKALFGESVALLVDGLTKLDKISFQTKEEAEMDNIRKMFLAMAKDIRVIVIKFADRLHNLSTLISMPEEKQREKARETLSIFAPIAHRLGMYRIKWELEDMSLKYLDPVAFHEISEGIAQKRNEREEFISHIKHELKQKLDDANIKCQIDGRAKHFYSIYRKMFTQNKTLDQIYDLFAVRVITENVSDCYTALGIAHELYTPMPGRFKDYIAMPKPNMYQSLHTTVIGHNGTPVEIQIRTKEMHEIAENGIAAHWKYKGIKEGEKDFEAKLSWIRQLLEIQNDSDNEEEFLRALKIDLFTDQVFVFTPKGDVMSFPVGATPVDFAFTIHSAIGYKMQGARVNGKIVPLDYQLQNSDIVEVITSSSVHGPSRDWLKFVKTSQARGKINQWFKKENREENIIKGKEILEKEVKRLGVEGADLLTDEYLISLFKRYGYSSVDDLYCSVGYGSIPINKIIARLKEEHRKTTEKKETTLTIENISSVVSPSSLKGKSSDGVVVSGIDNCLIRYSKCCNPVPGDRIIGYITRGRGVSVHRQDCVNIVNAYTIPEEKARLIEVSWATSKETSFNASLKIETTDRPNMLFDIAGVFSETKTPIKTINARSKENVGFFDVTVEINDIEQLEKIITKLRNVKDVIDVSRSHL
ncbi:MAG: bifunctional (p)ppGpp synthetase/guanosine-3',5'-bis(diphosphate) 3'-pyrophosphohydrolase [Ruminococcaceae bacterium]|nr:bifunctional (p)ppGpp synthetase/guanosine-3',5'-bis(diphosphate) 3'-pyrophosphohydrolase [Oscillospiraceae bacterium]